MSAAPIRSSARTRTAQHSASGTPETARCRPEGAFGEQSSGSHTRPAGRRARPPGCRRLRSAALPARGLPGTTPAARPRPDRRAPEGAIGEQSSGSHARPAGHWARPPGCRPLRSAALPARGLPSTAPAARPRPPAAGPKGRSANRAADHTRDAPGIGPLHRGVGGSDPLLCPHAQPPRRTNRLRRPDRRAPEGRTGEHNSGSHARLTGRRARPPGCRPLRSAALPARDPRVRTPKARAQRTRALGRVSAVRRRDARPRRPPRRRAA